MQAQVLLTEGNVDAALTTITGVTETNPRNASAGLLRCKLLHSLGANKELLKDLNAWQCLTLTTRKHCAG